MMVRIPTPSNPTHPTDLFHQGPNTVTGHLSVIYTVECQINFTLRLLDPILRCLPSYRNKSSIPSLLPQLAPAPSTVEVLPSAAHADFAWTQSEARKLVWASGCTNWAVDPKTGLNNMMYPDWQFMFWLRSVFWRKGDFVYKEETGRTVRPGEARRWVVRLAMAGVCVGAFLGKDWLREELPRRLREFDGRAVVSSLTAGRY
jgi:hypothetical protein